MNTSDSNSQKIVNFLNELLEGDPSLVKLFNAGTPANDFAINHPILNVRPCEGGDYVTVAGIIYAIGVLLGDGVVSTWDTDDGKNDLTGFKLQSHSVFAEEKVKQEANDA